MMIMRSAIFALGLLLFPFFPSLSLAEEPGQAAEAWMTVRAQSLAREGTSVDKVRDGLLRTYWSTDIDGGGISESDHVLQRQISIAQRRANQVSRTLKLDLDGDGRVTIAELKASLGKRARQPLRSNGVLLQPTDDQIAKTLDKLIKDQLKSDRNGDDVIGFSEMLSVANAGIQKRFNKIRRHQRQTIPPSIDLNNDKTISLDEFRKVVDLVLKKLDADSDGMFSATEVANVRGNARRMQNVLRDAERKQRQKVKHKEAVRNCLFPVVAPGTKTILLSASKGRALSTVNLGDDTVSVSVANIKIEPGREPLYIVLTSVRAMIWQFSGAVERVQMVVGNSQTRFKSELALSAMTGIEKRRVHFSPSGNCLRYFRGAKSSKALAAKAKFKALTGRMPDVILSETNVGAVSLPSGVFDGNAAYRNASNVTEDGPAAVLWREFKRFYPGGLIKLDPDRVVAPVKVNTYQVLPESAGLAGLIETGALKIIGTEAVIRYQGMSIVPGGGADRIVLPKGRNAEVIQQPNEFLILKKIRFPAGLSGALSANFQLAPGVPVPTGKLGHSCVRSQETGELLAGSRSCR